jgi:hypothetical protein
MVSPSTIPSSTLAQRIDWRTHRVSASLSLECDPVSQPDASDPVERLTWCMLRIRVAGRTVTRVWDQSLQQERSFLYVPAFPIAEWIVNNWWILLNEPCPTPEVPRPSRFQLPWIKQHCLRCADSGLLLPALYLFNDGRGIGVEWQADTRDSLPHMPGELVDSNRDHLDSIVTQNALSEFVNSVLARVKELDEERVKTTLATWDAIRMADSDEAKFCIAAGRLGIDPYDPAQMPDDLASFLESSLGDPEQPLVRDLTEAADPGAIVDQWSWVQGTSNAYHLGPSPGSKIAPPPVTASPFAYGYRLAARVREAAGLSPKQPVPSLLEIARRAAHVDLETPHQNHVPGRKLRAVVGWKPNGAIVIAGPPPLRRDTQRFLDARGLYHGLFACAFSQRLLTRAYTWDQQASRAFAAELLAPRAALTIDTPEQVVDHAAAERLAQEFDVSTKVIENQPENAGVAVVEE